jgi:hypothetical protein
LNALFFAVSYAPQSWSAFSILPGTFLRPECGGRNWANAETFLFLAYVSVSYPKSSGRFYMNIGSLVVEAFLTLDAIRPSAKTEGKPVPYYLLI